MIKKLLLIFALLQLANCVKSTPYKKAGSFSLNPGGFAERKLTQDSYKVTFNGNGLTKLKVAKDYALLRSAEVTKESKFEYFFLQDGSTAKYNVVNTYVCIQGSCNWVTSYHPTVKNLVKLTHKASLKSKKPKIKIYEAKSVIDEIVQKYSITSKPVPLDKNMKSISEFKLPKTPKDGYATIYVLRPQPYGTLVRFKVFLDSKEKTSAIGHNRGSQYIYFDVKAGKHEVFSKAGNWDSIKIDAKSKDVIFIKQQPTAGGFILRNKLSFITQLEAKEHIQYTKLGTKKNNASNPISAQTE